jgi:hypothetical protein
LVTDSDNRRAVSANLDIFAESEVDPFCIDDAGHAFNLDSESFVLVEAKSLPGFLDQKVVRLELKQKRIGP